VNRFASVDVGESCQRTHFVVNKAIDRGRGRKRLVMILMALAVLLPSLYGFGTKFLEFVALFRGDVDGAFAISPILNYLLASTGFLLLFGWAVLHGMFRDVEQPKYQMLENEARLDGAISWFEKTGETRSYRTGLTARPNDPYRTRWNNTHERD
jgi:hypothetical protein